MGRNGNARCRDRRARGCIPSLRAVFEEKELVDLTIAISLMNVYNRFGYRLPEHTQAALEK